MDAGRHGRATNRRIGKFIPICLSVTVAVSAMKHTCDGQTNSSVRHHGCSMSNVDDEDE